MSLWEEWYRLLRFLLTQPEICKIPRGIIFPLVEVGAVRIRYLKIVIDRTTRADTNAQSDLPTQVQGPVVPIRGAKVTLFRTISFLEARIQALTVGKYTAHHWIVAVSC